MIDYLEDVKKLIAKQYELDEDDIEEDSFLETDLNISDLDLEDFIDVLQDKFQIQIPQETYEKFKQVGDIANYLYENVDQA